MIIIVAFFSYFDLKVKYGTRNTTQINTTPESVIAVSIKMPVVLSIDDASVLFRSHQYAKRSYDINVLAVTIQLCVLAWVRVVCKDVDENTF